MSTPRNLDNWLDAYLAYTNESESPDIFHLWCGISAIASVLKRRVFFDMGYFFLFPNNYIVLVSPPGRCKKSTAMRMAREVLEPVPDIDMSSDSTTRERLILDLSLSFKNGHSAMTAHSSEFASMLTSSGMDMVVFLTDIYDSPSLWSHRTKNSGTSEIKAPYLNLLGGTTPDWIAKAMPLDTIGIGLTSRIVFVYSDQPRIRDPFPQLSESQKKLKMLLVQDLIKIAQVTGEYTLTPDAREFYTDWYKSRAPSVSGDTRLSGYFERKHMHVIKLAMVLCAARMDERVIGIGPITSAIDMLTHLEPLMRKVFSGVGKNLLNVSVEEALVKIINRPEGFTFGELFDEMRHDVSQEKLTEVINALLIINKISMKNGRYYSISS